MKYFRAKNSRNFTSLPLPDSGKTNSICIHLDTMDGRTELLKQYRALHDAQNAD